MLMCIKWKTDSLRILCLIFDAVTVAEVSLDGFKEAIVLIGHTSLAYIISYIKCIYVRVK